MFSGIWVRIETSFSEHGDEASGLIKSVEFLDYQRDRISQQGISFWNLTQDRGQLL
jgi:hypothetical protein